MSASSSLCTACGANAVAGGVCARCGYASGEPNRCPHCAAVAAATPASAGATLRWVCGVCGGPRMPGGLGGDAAATPLREAKASSALAARGRAAFWVFVTMALLVAMVAAVAWPAALVGKLLLLALMMTPAVLAVRVRTRAGHAKADADEAIERAWLAAAEDVAGQAKQGVTVGELATRLKVDPSRAEKLLTELAVHDRTRIDVGDDAEVRYSLASSTVPEGAARVRVDATEEAFLALERDEAAKSGRSGRSGSAPAPAGYRAPDHDDARAAEPDAAEPDAAEPDAAEPDAAEPDAAEPDAAEPPGDPVLRAPFPRGTR